MAENPLEAPLNIAGVWRCDTRCDPKKVDGIIRHGRFGSERASVSVSLSYKLATERMYSNNESFLPDKVKRNELEKTRGESGRESEYYKEPCADRLTWLVFEYQVQAFLLWWIHMAGEKWCIPSSWLQWWCPMNVKGKQMVACTYCRWTTTVLITNDGVG